MSKKYLVSRHPGAHGWAMRLAYDEIVGSLDINQINAGDVVYGTLPIALAAEVIARGARFISLTLDTPPALRGRELTSKQMAACGARVEEFFIERRRGEFDTDWRASQLVSEPVVTVVAMMNTKQVLANLIPVLLLKPARVIIFDAGGLDGRYKHLSAALKKAGLTATDIARVKITADYAANLITISKALLKNADSANLVSNIAGGKKPQSLALAEATRKAGGEVIYYDGEQQRLEILRAVGGAADAVPDGLLTVELWLAAQGQEHAVIETRLAEASPSIPAAVALVNILHAIQKNRQRALQMQGTNFLLSAMDPLHKVLAKYNNSATKKSAHKESSVTLAISAMLLEPSLAQHLRAVGVLDATGVTLTFANQAQVDFFAGLWLEYWVLHALSELGYPQSVRGVHLKVLNTLSDENELDVVTTDQNQLVVFECKAGGATGAEAQAWLNKLAAVGRRVGSKMSKKL